jgi:glycerate kinase
LGFKILIAPDSFKDALPAAAACRAMAAGVRRALPDAEIRSLPVADGGEGFAATLVEATGGREEILTVTGPLGEPVEACLAVLGDGQTAVVELARASGLEMVPVDKRNPLHTTTYGTGELIWAGLDLGFRRILAGIGGSATTDGGAGALQALGVRFLDPDGKALPSPATGAMLERIAAADLSGLHPAAAGASIRVACDVSNPLLGPRGSARTYARQKGASEADVERLEAGMAVYARAVEEAAGRAFRHLPGTGAAGGIGFGLTALLGAELVPGIELVLDALDFRSALGDADLVLTGEGRVDAQTASGKAVLGVAGLASAAGVPVVALAGSLGGGWDSLYNQGLTAAFSICPGPMRLEESVSRTAELLEAAAERVMRTWISGRIA